MCAFVMLATVACSSSAVAPTAGPGTGTSTPPAPVTYHLEGRVLDEAGAPVVGATVGTSSPSSLTAITDQSGAYQMMGTLKGVFELPDVVVSKAGYDATRQSGTPQGSRDLHLFHSISASAHGQLHATLGPDNSLCGNDDEFLCRAILIAAPAPPATVVTIASDDAAHPVWLVPNGLFYPLSLATRFQIPGSTTPELLVVTSALSAGFTIQTSDPIGDTP